MNTLIVLGIILSCAFIWLATGAAFMAIAYHNAPNMTDDGYHVIDGNAVTAHQRWVIEQQAERAKR